MERGWESGISNQHSVESGEWRGGGEGKGVAMSSLFGNGCKGVG